MIKCKVNGKSGSSVILMRDMGYNKLYRVVDSEKYKGTIVLRVSHNVVMDFNDLAKDGCWDNINGQGCTEVTPLVKGESITLTQEQENIMKKYYVKNISMLEAFVEGVHRAKCCKLRAVVKNTATVRIQRLKLQEKDND